MFAFTRFTASFGTTFFGIGPVRCRILDVGSLPIVIPAVLITSVNRIISETDRSVYLRLGAVRAEGLVSGWCTVALSGNFLAWFRLSVFESFR